MAAAFLPAAVSFAAVQSPEPGTCETTSSKQFSIASPTPVAVPGHDPPASAFTNAASNRSSTLEKQRGSSCSSSATALAQQQRSPLALFPAAFCFLAAHRATWLV